MRQRAQNSFLHVRIFFKNSFSVSDNTTKRLAKNLHSSNNLSEAGESERKDKYLHLIKKYELGTQVTLEEKQAKRELEMKKKKSLERCYILYEKGKIKNEVNRIMYHKMEELKMQSELKECTWRPRLNKISKQLEDNLKVIIKDTKIYNRTIQWKFKNNHKISRSKSDMHRDESEYTFRPIVKNI